MSAHPLASAHDQPTERRTYDATRLMAEHPPVLHDANKRIVFRIACPPGAVFGGALEFSRWPEMALPSHLQRVPPGFVIQVPGFFDYAPRGGVDRLEWHLNFADPEVFGYYGGGLLAQDELQVAEHPALGALREALLAEGIPARTVERGRPTPVLVRGVERRVAIATDPDAAAGRPHGLYGNLFRRASPEVLVRAVTAIEPPTRSNIVAIAALPGGSGTYRRDEIEVLLATAFSGFRAAVVESTDVASAEGAIIHTGYWGCGAFGGNRILMALLQVAAASMAGMEQVVFHTGAAGGVDPLAEALETLAELVPADGIATGDLITALVERGYEPGPGDGN